jgi:glycosyltransferase involved in cell wall biosynthesis
MSASGPLVSVIVPARDAAATIGRTLAALSAQDLDGPFEVVVIDDGSTDETVRIARAAAGGRVRVLQEPRRGAADARNRGAATARAPVLAFTDADCFPSADWLRAGLAALESADLVQGRVKPPPGEPLGPFDRTVWVDAERGFYETANLFVTRSLFERVGGLEDWLETGGEKLLAEDVWFGWRCVRAGARTGFAPDALVHHAIFPRGPLGYVDERRRFRYFPAIARKVPEFRRRTLFARVFLTRRSAGFDAAVAGCIAARAARSPLPLAAAAPYAAMVARSALPWRRRAPLVAAVAVAADAVGLVSLLAGSARWRSVVL